ncbi:BZ3500_MvSof-1268-A1-R1_Chr4-2g07192 [Microbotryum saponariae]|uniref:Alpha N-terminal protein methyltransferase 1 n=1 Tax=Microbotryum saponariae TaxID=289078 RepID=A0A2X0NMA9_9BASI|nr:BZ3500_MvSof-1268-A1-R1_Chr4-2g07192 [Microbotryum saponariae]SDA06857.1 BZ3501_MvSof-1269-A2-R1_Chr4-2g06903 [Microbotryum saponariae]
MTTTASAPAPAARLPQFQVGVDYWAKTEATVNGVLGGYGPATAVPRLDATASRMLILSIMPHLSTVTPPHRASISAPETTTTTPSQRRSFRALDCGAGIGRVTSTLPLFDRVDLVEPVPKFLKEAQRHAERGREGWKYLSTGKGVRMWQAGLQFFDPAAPAIPVPPIRSEDPQAVVGTVELVATYGSEALVWPDPKRRMDTESGGAEDGYDLCMIQWCIGHLSDAELVEFLKRSRKALRQDDRGCQGYIILKENVCKDTEGAGAGFLFDDDDSSVTRSDKVFKNIFADAGLDVLRQETQQGFPKELFPVIAYVLR